MATGVIKQDGRAVATGVTEHDSGYFCDCARW